MRIVPRYIVWLDEPVLVQSENVRMGETEVVDRYVIDHVVVTPDLEESSGYDAVCYGIAATAKGVPFQRASVRPLYRLSRFCHLPDGTIEVENVLEPLQREAIDAVIKYLS